MMDLVIGFACLLVLLIGTYLLTDFDEPNDDGDYEDWL